MRHRGALQLLLLVAAADESLLRATIELDGATRVDVTSPSLGAARASAAHFCEMLGHNATVDGGGSAATTPTCTDAVTRALVRSSPEARDPSAHMRFRLRAEAAGGRELAHVVLDDVLADPDAVREFALAQPLIKGNHPGLRTRSFAHAKSGAGGSGAEGGAGRAPPCAAVRDAVLAEVAARRGFSSDADPAGSDPARARPLKYWSCVFQLSHAKDDDNAIHRDTPSYERERERARARVVEHSSRAPTRCERRRS